MSIPLLIIIILAALWQKVDQLLSKEVKRLFSQGGRFSGQTYDEDSIEALPPPVKNYFKKVLVDGQPYINYVRLKHTGQFKTSLKGQWTNIIGEEYFTAVNPGMIWRGKTKWFTAYDTLMSGKGKLTVYLFSILRIVNGEGATYSQGELLRWLGENVLFPTNLLPSKTVQWSAIDKHTAELKYTNGDLEINYTVTFRDTGEITKLKTKRYMDKHNMKTWIGKLSDYRQLNGIYVPTTIEGAWEIGGKEFPYAKFKIRELQYNVPEQF